MITKEQKREAVEFCEGTSSREMARAGFDYLTRVEVAGSHAAESLRRAQRLPQFRTLLVGNAGTLNAAAGWYGSQLGIASLVPQKGEFSQEGTERAERRRVA